MTRLFTFVTRTTFLIFVLGCTPKAPSPWVSGHALFESRPFRPQEVTELWITVHQSERDQNWTARFVRNENPQTPMGLLKPALEWKIASPPDTANAINDSFANRQFINHLLDALSLVKVTAPTADQTKNPLPPLDRIGLSPARFKLLWKTANQSYELSLGDVHPKYGVFAQLGNSTKGQQKQLSVGFVSSTPSRLLEAIREFNELRLRSFSTYTADEVYQIDIQTKNQPYLFAERAGAQWVGKNGSPLKPKLSAQIAEDLKSFTQLPVLEYLPCADTAEFEKHAQRIVTLSNRKGEKMTFWLQSKTANSPYLKALSSDRPGFIAQIDASALRLFRP